MLWQYVFFAMIPALAHAVLERRAPIRTTVACATGLAALEFVLGCWMVGLVEPFTFASLALFWGLGLIAIRRGSPRLVRLQPVVLELGMGLVFFVAFFVFDEPLFAQLLDSQIGVLDVIPPYQRGYFAGYFETMSASVPFLLFLHAGLVAWAARRESVVPWILTRSIGLYALLVVLFFAERLLIEPV
jgi:intracellular septation protein A